MFPAGDSRISATSSLYVRPHDQDPEPLPRYRFPDLVRPLDRHPGHVLRQRVVDGAAGKNHLTVGAHLLCPLDTVVRVHGDTGPRVAR